MLEMNISSNPLKSPLGIKFLWGLFLIGYSFLTMETIAMADSMIDSDRVIRIDDRNMSEPIGIYFDKHAAIYFLKRDDPHFVSYPY